MNSASIYGELSMDPESNRIQWAFKGLREHVVIMNSPPNAYPDQEIYIEIPRGSEGDVMIPQIPQVTFDLNVESSKDKSAYRKSGTRDRGTLGLGTRDTGLVTRDSGPGTRDPGLGTRDSELLVYNADQPVFNRDRKERENISVFLYCNFI